MFTVSNVLSVLDNHETQAKAIRMLSQDHVLKTVVAKQLIPLVTLSDRELLTNRLATMFIPSLDTADLATLGKIPRLYIIYVIIVNSSDDMRVMQEAVEYLATLDLQTLVDIYRYAKNTGLPILTHAFSVQARSYSLRQVYHTVVGDRPKEERITFLYELLQVNRHLSREILSMARSHDLDIANTKLETLIAVDLVKSSDIDEIMHGFEMIFTTHGIGKALQLLTENYNWEDSDFISKILDNIAAIYSDNKTLRIELQRYRNNYAVSRWLQRQH